MSERDEQDEDSEDVEKEEGDPSEDRKNEEERNTGNERDNGNNRNNGNGRDGENGEEDETREDDTDTLLSGILTALVGISVILFSGLTQVVRVVEEGYAENDWVFLPLLGLAITLWGFVGTYIRRRL